jgi:hypothetical protein
MDNPKPPFYRRLFTLTWEGAYRWLLGLALGAILAWLSQRRMPSAIAHPAAYWFLSGGVFFGSFVAFLLLAQGTAWSIRKVRAMCNPPKLTITAHGGNKAAVEVQHGGVPAVWQARIRILKVSGNTFNPDTSSPNPRLRQCYFEKDGETYRDLRLTDGEVASVVLAEMKYSHYLSSHRETWVAILNADDERDTRVSGDTTVELSFGTKPTQKKLAVKRCFIVKRLASDVMECVDVPCVYDKQS